MPKISRRSFLAASAGLIAAPALHARTTAADVDVAIIGAGAAGIAAARRIAEAKRSFRLIEAGRRIGGRCVTDSALFGVPFDLGAHWIHAPDDNPLAKLSPAGLDITPAPRGLSARVGPRDARDAELERLLAALVNTRRALADAAKAKAEADMAALQALPNNLGAWRETIAFIDGPFACGKDLAEVSAVALGRAPKRTDDAFCRQGYGALLARLAAGLPVQLDTPVGLVATAPRLAVDSPRGTLFPRAVILTVSTNMLTSGKIEFLPALPKRLLDAAAKLSLGSYDHIALELPGNPLGLLRDDLVFEQAHDTRTAALLANVSGSSLHLVEVAGPFGRDLSAQEAPAMIDFAREWLASLFGTGVKDKIKRSHATRWDAEPWALGAMSAPAPGAAEARRVLLEPLGGRVWFAGEALHATKWGTVAGAWESGEHAAEAVLRHLGGRREREPEKPARHKRLPRQHRRRQ
jgi:monoamine oxidase